MSTALKILPSESEDLTETGKDTKEKVENTYTEELFFSICSPIGSLKEKAIAELKHQLENNYDYKVKIIKLSTLIEGHSENQFSPIAGKTDAFSTYNFKITEGNKLRKKYNNQILSELAIADIHSERAEPLGEDHLFDRNYKSRRYCYIIDSLKSKEELLLLRSVYTDNFYQLSVFSPLSERVDNLISKGFSQPEATEIIQTDEYQNTESGQNVRGTFVEGDFFLRISQENSEKTNGKIERYLHLIFESKVVTPTIEETSMFSAKAAASNSSCLSRQVGASVTDAKGVLLSTGWNDVPKFGGNLYDDAVIDDNRCFIKGYCTNDKEKDKLTDNISEILFADDDIKNLFITKDGIDNNKLDEFKRKIRKSKIKDLIEFSRAVHAEMHAIIGSVKLTVSGLPLWSSARGRKTIKVGNFFMPNPTPSFRGTRLPAAGPSPPSWPVAWSIFS